MTSATREQIHTAVTDHYAEAARTAADGGTAGSQDFTETLYPAEQRDQLPEQAVLASLGCGNPTLLAELQPGQTVLDLGSGGGIDVLLSARRVGPEGKAYGLDMTDEMLDLARRNAADAGATNVEFLKGHIEAIPLPDASVDVIISNCVINLAADKDAVFAEAIRVLRPGGQLAVADIVLTKPLPPEVRKSMTLWADCTAGALTDTEYRAKLTAAGFTGIDLQVLQTFDRDAIAAVIDDANNTLPEDFDTDETCGLLADTITSTFVRACRPA